MHVFTEHDEITVGHLNTFHFDLKHVRAKINLMLEHKFLPMSDHLNGQNTFQSLLQLHALISPSVIHAYARAYIHLCKNHTLQPFILESQTNYIDRWAFRDYC